MSKRSTRRFKYYGGRPVLDLVNTIAWRRRETPEDLLRTASDLLDWAAGAGLIPGGRPEPDADDLGRSGADEAALRRIRDLRGLAARLLEAVIDEGAPSRSDLDELNDLAAELQSGSRVNWDGEAYRWVANPMAPAALEIHRQLTRGLIDLLTSEELARVARCQDDRGCGWLFLDASRAGDRRWCSMRDCGNRAKAERHARRARAR